MRVASISHHCYDARDVISQIRQEHARSAPNLHVDGQHHVVLLSLNQEPLWAWERGGVVRQVLDVLVTRHQHHGLSDSREILLQNFQPFHYFHRQSHTGVLVGADRRVVLREERLQILIRGRHIRVVEAQEIVDGIVIL